MFKVDDIVRFAEPKKCDCNSYRIIAVNPSGTLDCYDITDVKSAKRYRYSVPARYLTLDLRYRTKKIEKICSRLVTK